MKYYPKYLVCCISCFGRWKETSQSLQVNILVFTGQLKFVTNNQHDKQFSIPKRHGAKL